MSGRQRAVKDQSGNESVIRRHDGVSVMLQGIAILINLTSIVSRELMKCRNYNLIKPTGWPPWVAGGDYSAPHADPISENSSFLIYLFKYF